MLEQITCTILLLVICCIRSSLGLLLFNRIGRLPEICTLFQTSAAGTPMSRFTVNICFKHSEMNSDTMTSHPPVLRESCGGGASCREIRLLQESEWAQLPPGPPPNAHVNSYHWHAGW